MLYRTSTTIIVWCSISYASVGLKSLDLPFWVGVSEIFSIAVLAQTALTIDVAKLEVFAGPLDVMINHVDENRTAE